MSITKIRGIQIEDLTLLDRHVDTTAAIQYIKLEHIPLATDGFNSPTADIDWGNFKLTNLAPPTEGTDATRKSYVDNLVSGLFWKEPALYMIQYVKTDAGAPSGTATDKEVCINTNDDKLYQYDSTAWVELTLTATDIFIFGKNGTDTSGDSGTYTADMKTYTWDGAAWVDAVPANNEARLVQRDSYLIDSDTGWTYNNDDTEWIQFSGAGQIVPGPGLAKDGNQLYIPDDGVKDSMIDWGTGALQVDLDDVPDGTNYGKILNTQISSGVYIDGTNSGTKGIVSFDGNEFSVTSGAVSIATDGIDSTHIDFGTGVNQVSLDDVPDGTSYERLLATQVDSGIYIDATSSVKGIASYSASHFLVTTGAVTIAADAIDDTLIDFGTGANQVNAADIPLVTAVEGETEVQAALEALETASDNLDIFKTVSVAGQDDIVSDGNTDTLTFAAGQDVTITTDSTSNVVTIASGGATSLTASLGVKKNVNNFEADIRAGQNGLALDVNSMFIDASQIIDTTKALAADGSEQIGVVVDTTRGMEIDAVGGLRVNLDDGDGSLDFNGATGIRVAADGIQDTHIDWGTGAGQVNGLDVPLTVTVSSQTNVEDALVALETAQNALDIFKTFSVSGQDDVVADGTTDTITFVAGNDISITTDSGSQAITIASTGADAITADQGVKRTLDNLTADILVDGGIRLNGNSMEIALDAGEILYNDGTSVVGHEMIVRETPSGAINGVNTTYTLANAPAGDVEELYLNGVLQEPGGEDYTISGATITFVDAPEAGDRIRASYIS